MGSCDFAKIDITYRLSGSLANYQTRRLNEKVIKRDLNAKYVGIITREHYPFWFHQRILRYGSNAQVLTPDWFVEEIRKEHKKGNKNYEKKFIFLKGYREEAIGNRKHRTAKKIRTLLLQKATGK
ncbi:MAG: WYL domain-containing protein [Cyanobacteria bacterium J06639_18]